MHNWELGPILAKRYPQQRSPTAPALCNMKMLWVALAVQLLLVLQVHCAGKKAATSEPKVTSQVSR